jgi:16S rRNA (guanine966-N2)-methyltransferase
MDGYEGRGGRRRVALRVIAGKYRSRSLRSLGGMDVRPTSDRLRETLFDVLAAGNPAALEGSRWLDLFAGTGAVGIEAISRGASEVHFVESSSSALEAIRQNLESLGIAHGFHLTHAEVLRALGRIERTGLAADFVFLDPPYRLKQAYGSTLRALADSSLIGARSVVIAEHERKFDPGSRFGTLHRFRILPQGSAALSFYRRGNSDHPE